MSSVQTAVATMNGSSVTEGAANFPIAWSFSNTNMFAFSGESGLRSFCGSCYMAHSIPIHVSEQFLVNILPLLSEKHGWNKNRDGNYLVISALFPLMHL